MLRPELLPSRRFVHFCIAGMLGFLVDAGLTQWLIRGFDVEPLRARVPAIALAVLTTWLYNRSISFRASRSSGWLAELGRYAMGNALGLTINYAAYALAIAALALTRQWPILAVAVGSIAGLGVNYLLAHNFIFRGDR